MVDFTAVFTLAGDIMADLPDFENSFAIGERIIADIKAGNMPALSADDMAQFEKDMVDIKKIVNDIKALA